MLLLLKTVNVLYVEFRYKSMSKILVNITVFFSLHTYIFQKVGAQSMCCLITLHFHLIKYKHLSIVIKYSTNITFDGCIYSTVWG